jgi:hypothetical protein
MAACRARTNLRSRPVAFETGASCAVERIYDTHTTVCRPPTDFVGGAIGTSKNRQGVK